MPRQERLLDHEYDGISEYDNPTPGWWHLLFLGSVAFSVFYAMFWHGSPLAWTPQEALVADQQRYYGQLFKELGDLNPDEPTLIKLMEDEKWMAFGGALFAVNCAQCHGSEGTGINGPNLTDRSWINVKALPDLYKIITEGVSTKGMPAWNVRLGQNERVLVASYVARMSRNPKPGREPEGTPIDPWPSAAQVSTSDSATADPAREGS